MHETHLDRYARLLVEHGAGLRQDQQLYIRGEAAHRDLALRVAEAAYDLGAGAVHIRLKDPRMEAQMIRRAREEQLALFHERNLRLLNEIVRSHSALISLTGDEDPALMPRLAETHPERHALFTNTASVAAEGFRTFGINRSLCPWVVAGVATPGWAKQVFPQLSAAEAVDRLAALIFEFTYADRDDAHRLAIAKDRRLHARKRILDELQVREIRITGGGSDLTVGLSAKARWLGGSKQTAFGQTFNANMPSEENFTTPDRRLTQGRLVATMPFRTHSGLLVKDLVLTFRDGRVVELDASEGREGFERWIDSDDGARYLGEFALVGQDSPIARSGLFFEHTLFDENAWAHVALGQAYTNGLDGGATMTASELDAVGYNRSVIHTDLMFGSTEVSVTATRSREGEVVLIDHGEWTERFLSV
ncbi:MAG: aminopeptidase [Acidobacteriota bacterium]